MSNKAKRLAVVFIMCASVVAVIVSTYLTISTILSSESALLAAGTQLITEDFNKTPIAAENLEAYTVGLLNLSNDLKLATSVSKSTVSKQLTDYAQTRKTLVLKSMQTNPEVVLKGTISEKSLLELPADVRVLVEQRKQIQGKFEWEIVEYDNETAEDRFFIVESSSNKRYRIFVAREGFKSLTGDLVTINGLVLDNQIATFANDIQVRTAATTPTNVRKVASILVNFTDQTQSFSISSIRDRVYGIANNYFKENSFGKWGIVGKNTTNGTGDIFGPYTISYSRTACDLARIRDLAMSAMQSAGVDTSGYDNFLIFSPQDACSFGGAATVGGSPAYAHSFGNVSTGVIVHELGHNMGAQHASSLVCTVNGTKVSISEDSNCIIKEFGDPFNVMGTTVNLNHFNNYQKGTTLHSLNWLQPQNTLTIDPAVSPDATYTIAPIETKSTGIQAIRIPRTVIGNEVRDYYYLEYRQPVGFDQDLDIAATTGVTIRIATGYEISRRTKLIDTVPSTATFADAPLAVNKTFTDSGLAFNVTTLSANSSGARVRVHFGPRNCSRAHPTLSIAQTNVTLNAGQSVAIGYKLKNNDTSACPATSFRITPTLPAGFTQNINPIVHTIGGGITETGTFIITTPPDASTATYAITQSVQNLFVTSYKTTGKINMNVVGVDKTQPTVQIHSPANLAIVKGLDLMNISASASDASGIAYIQIYLDGKVIRTCNTATCSMTISAFSLSVGNHTIKFTATDKATPSNSASKSITITRR